MSMNKAEKGWYKMNLINSQLEFADTLSAMGLGEGTIFEVIDLVKSGILVEVKNIRLALGWETASQLSIEPINN